MASGSVTRPCVAVLPLQNFSANTTETDYMVDGMTEVLIAELAKNRSLRVVSRTTVMQFKDSRSPIRQIARVGGGRDYRRLGAPCWFLRSHHGAVDSRGDG